MAKDRDRRKGGKRESERDRRRAPKKKVSVLNTESITWIDYKDVNLLRRFMSERAKIRARRVTGNSAQQQRAVARAIRVAREMALLPYAVRQVTQRSKGSRGRDRDMLRELPRELAEPGAPPPAADTTELVSGEAAAPDAEALAGDEAVAEAPPAAPPDETGVDEGEATE
jgi:small subunit ribosomal protein S18